MAVTISDVVRCFKIDVANLLSADSIVQACRSLGYTWRRRVLDPATTVQLFLTQILHGNISCCVCGV
jgi:hypothetical protein